MALRDCRAVHRTKDTACVMFVRWTAIHPRKDEPAFEGENASFISILPNA